MDELEARLLTRTAHRSVHEDRDVHNIVNITVCVNNAGHGGAWSVRNMSMIRDFIDMSK